MEAKARSVGPSYRGKATRLDVEVRGEPRGAVGAVRARLDGYGDVVPLGFGAFGEVNAGVRRFVDMLAEQRAQQFLKHDRAFEGEKSVAVGYIRRRLSFVGARARAQLRLQRLRQVEVGSAAEVGRWQQRRAARVEREAAARAEHAAVLAGAFFRHAQMAR